MRRWGGCGSIGRMALEAYILPAVSERHSGGRPSNRPRAPLRGVMPAGASPAPSPRGPRRGCPSAEAGRPPARSPARRGGRHLVFRPAHGPARARETDRDHGADSRPDHRVRGGGDAVPLSSSAPASARRHRRLISRRARRFRRECERRPPRPSRHRARSRARRRVRQAAFGAPIDTARATKGRHAVCRAGRRGDARGGGPRGDLRGVGHPAPFEGGGHSRSRPLEILLKPWSSWGVIPREIVPYTGGSHGG